MPASAAPALARSSFTSRLRPRVGGALAIVKDGDEIELDVREKRLELLLPEAEIKARLAQWTPPAPHYSRGYGKVYLDHILQAHQGCDFDFLLGRDGEGTTSPLTKIPQSSAVISEFMSALSLDSSALKSCIN